jgi:hypothetical protein
VDGAAAQVLQRPQRLVVVGGKLPEQLRLLLEDQGAFGLGLVALCLGGGDEPEQPGAFALGGVALGLDRAEELEQPRLLGTGRLAFGLARAHELD